LIIVTKVAQLTLDGAGGTSGHIAGSCLHLHPAQCRIWTRYLHTQSVTHMVKN